MVNGKDVKLEFVGVGAAKSGTSWLAACLAEHPALCMAQPKELNYFCQRAIWPEFRVHNYLGADWLHDRFAHCKPGQLRGEFSPNYLCDPQSPRLIFDHNPECRLIFCFRHPVEAVASYYYQIRKETPVADTFEGFLAEHPDISRIGNYYLHVQAFLGVFPREQCLFLLFDDIQQNARAVLRECFSFLAVEEDFIPGSITQKINPSEKPRSKALLAAMDWTRRLAQRRTSAPVVQRWLWKLQLYRLHGWVLQQNLQPFRPPPISENIRRRLLDAYRDDIRALAAFLGRDLSHWEC